MAIVGQSVLRVMVRFAEFLRQRRRRRIGERIMNDLPPSLQKDIGWEPTRPPRRV